MRKKQLSSKKFFSKQLPNKITSPIFFSYFISYKYTKVLNAKTVPREYAIKFMFLDLNKL